MNKVNFATSLDKETLKVLWHQELSFDDENYIEYYFNNKYDDDYHYVLKDENNNILSYVNRSLHSVKLNNKNIQISILKNFIYDSKDHLVELLKEVEDHLNHQELITLIDDRDNLFDLPYYETSKLFEFKQLGLSLNSRTHLTEIVEPSELLECYGGFIKHFNGFELRDLSYFNEKIKENIATSSRYLVFKEDNKVHGYALVHKNVVKELVYFKKEVIDEVLTYLFVNYDNILINTSIYEALDKIYDCKFQTIHKYKYQINNLDLLQKLFNLDINQISETITHNIWFK